MGGEAERDGRHPVSRPCCLARMCAAMRRRQPRDRIDYDFVSADNEAVTSTERRAQRRGRGASQHFPPRRSPVFREREGSEEDLFKVTHFLYLSSGERRDG